MTGITDLPVEILDQIINEISTEQQSTLSNLSLTCRTLYHQVVPALYHTFRLKFFGRPSWPTRADILKRLAPPGSYELLVYSTEDGDESEPEASLVDRKGKGVAGRPSAHRHRSLNSRKDASVSAGGRTAIRPQSRKLPLMFIREVVICGYWNHPKEELGEEYYFPNDGDVREHTPFIEALEGFLWSIECLEGFQWKITRPLPSQISAAVARFSSLRSVSIFGDTHMYTRQPTYRYHQHSPSPLTNSPVPFSYNSLTTLRALQTGDYQQVIQYGDVMRSGSNWNTIRNLEFDVSPGFIGMLVEMEPLEPDILAALFRPPPPLPGRLTAPKMKLHQLKLRDVAFQYKGIDALVKSIDASRLRDLDLYYCQEGADLLRRWENNKLKSLERVHVKEELALPYLSKFLKQFGPEGACRNLKTLELCCWHVDRWNLYDPMHPPNVPLFTDYDSDSEIWDDEDDMYPDDDLSDDTHLDYPLPAIRPRGMAPKVNYQLPQPFKSIKDLRGKKEERWGLERLVLDMRPGVSTITTRQLPQQETFFEGFWRMRELAIPVSYDSNEAWNQFVDTMAKLPNLEYLFLLNARTEARSGSNYVSFNIYQPPFMMQPRPANTRSNNKRKAKAAPKEQEPDKLYVDALAIASRNRLRVHSNGIAHPTTTTSSSSSAAAAQSVWRGKLKYIGIRAMYPIGIRQPVRVWKVVVGETPPKKAVAEGAVERRRSLRSSKRRKVESGDWRVVEEGGMDCRLAEIEDDAVKGEVGAGIFRGMQRFEGEPY